MDHPLDPDVINIPDGDGGAVELFLVMPPGDEPDCRAQGADGRPALLIVHGHQFPERPGGQGRLTPALMDRLSGRGGIAAAVSQPGYGNSTGPPDCCGPRTQAALRLALDHLVACGADPSRTVLWAISRGAIAAACAFVDAATEPGVLILQAGTYDMEHWVEWVRNGAPGGDVKLAKAILANQKREAGLTQSALKARSGTRYAARGSCDVLLVHGRADPQSPQDDLGRMTAALCKAGRRVETALAPEGEHRLPPSLTLNALARYWPDLAI